MVGLELPPLPGGIGLTHLRVYDSEAPDGLRGGTPHLHTVCTEAYWVVRGEGAVQTISAAGFGESPLVPGAVAWFTPGTIHRLVNRSGDLEILVLMGNAGLPEAGDMVITFAPDIVTDPDRYLEAATLPGGATTTAGRSDPARRRRDLAVEGFTVLRDALDAGDRGPLDGFLDAAGRLVAPRIADWRDRWTQGPLAAARTTGAQLDALARGDVSHLARAAVHRREPPPDERRLGCCGTLGTYVIAD